MPFTLGTLFTFDIFLNLFLNERKARKFLPLIFIVLFVLIFSVIIIKYWETLFSMLIIFAILEPLKNRFLLKDDEKGNIINHLLFCSNFCLLSLTHVIIKTFENQILEKYLCVFLMYGFMSAINFYLYKKAWLDAKFFNRI